MTQNPIRRTPAELTWPRLTEVAPVMMSQSETDEPVVELYPLRLPNGETIFAAWPDAVADWIVEVGSHLVAASAGKLMLCGCGLVTLLLVFSRDRRRRR